MPNVCDSSTVMTPSLPTLSMASAICSPISSSAAEMEATCAMSSLDSTSLAWFLMASTAALDGGLDAALQRHRVGAGGHVAQAFLDHGLGEDRGRGGAVTGHVVGLLGDFLDQLGPDLLLGSSSSISLAMETPSLVIVGAPHFFSRTTLRPLGPRVILTALASWSIPRSRARRASSSNVMILAAMLPPPCG